VITGSDHSIVSPRIIIHILLSVKIWPILHKRRWYIWATYKQELVLRSSQRLYDRHIASRFSLLASSYADQNYVR